MIPTPATFPDAVAMLAMAAVFTILTIAYQHALGGMLLGAGGRRLPLALAASLLSVIGMFGMHGGTTGGEGLRFVLLPYEAVGLSLLLLLVVALFACAGARRKQHRDLGKDRDAIPARRSKGDGGPLRAPSAKVRTKPER